MRFNKIPEVEIDILDFNLPGLVFTQDGIVEKVSRSDKSVKHYYQFVYDKERIVLHFTCGNLRGDLYTLVGTEPVSTAFLIARNGQVYELFDPKYWSYHLGKGAMGGNAEQSRKTIGIELSNYGPLILKGSELHTIYSKTEAPDVYCHVENTSAYTRLDIPFRGYQYFASFTDLQYASLVDLLKRLSSEFSIPLNFLEQDLRYISFADVTKFYGVVSHINYRSAGKWDIGPAFDWNRIIQGITAQ